jgi:hypothetical protein
VDLANLKKQAILQFPEWLYPRPRAAAPPPVSMPQMGQALFKGLAPPSISPLAFEKNKFLYKKA